MKYYLDTNICIYFMKGKFNGLRETLLSKNPNDIKIPAIVKAELLYGAEKSNQRKRNIEKINAFLFAMQIVGFGDFETAAYSQIRANFEKKGLLIGPNDLIIAATVKANEGVLVTNNTREFERVAGLNIENWAKE